VTGGEPVDGCEAVAALIVGDSLRDIENRAATLGIWHPYAWPNLTPSRREADMALDDDHTFVWRPGHERDWRPSATWTGALA
jgi:hypothetical protein